MKNSLILIRIITVLLLLFLHACQKDIFDDPTDGPIDEILFDVEIGNSEIPYLVIETRGLVILNEPKIPAELIIYNQKTEVQRTQIGIEYRGSTSFRLSDKKSYGIETWDPEGNDVDVAFFDFPEEEDFVLLGHVVNLDVKYVFDATLLYNFFGFILFGTMGHYASRTKLIELEINGQYQGVYVFMEKLKRDKNRIDVEKLEPTDVDTESITGGYILKIDKTAGGDLNINQPLEYFETNWVDDARYSSEICFRSQYDIYGHLINFDPFDEPYHSQQYLETYFLYEYPKSEEITTAQKTYIQGYIHDFETALLSDGFTTDLTTYTNYIDLGSFVDFHSKETILQFCRFEESGARRRMDHK